MKVEPSCILRMGMLGLLASLVACSDNGGEDEISSSSVEASSSSGFSDREEIVYGDTILQDTLHIRRLPDTTLGEPWIFFLGEYPAGTLITVNAATKDLKNAQLRVRAEGSLKYLAPALADKAGNYSEYMVPGTDTTIASIAINDFYTLTDGFYMLEVSGTADADTALLRLELNVQKARFQVAGMGDTLTLEANDTLRGFFPLDQSSDQVLVRFRSPAGFNLNLSTSGSLIDSVWLGDSASATAIIAGQSVIRKQLLPQKTSAWDLHIEAAARSYADGPYAFFELVLNSLELAQGEYFAYPDSIVKPGDTLVVVRPRNDAALYDVRHDQYVFLGKYKKGDSIQVSHSIAGFAGYTFIAYNILNAQGDSIATLSGANGFSYKIPADGSYYLHYYRMDSHATDEALTLTLATVVRQPGLLTGWRLVKENASGVIVDNEDAILKVGSTLKIASSLLWAPEPSTASKSAVWYILCKDVTDGNGDVLPLDSWVFTDGRGVASCAGELNPLQSLELVGQKAGVMSLVIQSVADPTKSDTLEITVE